MRFKPIHRAPFSARKCLARTRKAFPGPGTIKGWEWFDTLAEPDKTYAIAPDGRWYVAQGDCREFNQ